MNIITAIMSSKKREKQNFLNWDHDINPTSEGDFLLNLLSYAQRFSGSSLRGKIKNGVLTIEYIKSATFSRGSSFGNSIEPHWTCGLCFDMDYCREIYGRAYHFNLWSADFLSQWKKVTK